MARPMIILVSDNREHHEKVKTYGTGMGYSVQCYTTVDWGRGLQDSSFRLTVGADAPALAVGSSSGGSVRAFKEISLRRSREAPISHNQGFIEWRGLELV